MGNYTINERVVNAINFILSTGLESKKGDIAKKIGCNPQTVTEILGERQGAKVDFIQKLCVSYDISLEYIFNGTLPIGKLQAPSLQINEDISIPIVEISAAAGTGYFNPGYLSETDKILLPKNMVKQSCQNLCIRVKGDSMAPTLLDSGYLVISNIDPSRWLDIPDNHVYVVSDREGRTFVKRVKNRFEKGFIVLTSDNPEKWRYPSFNLQTDEIVSIWHVDWYFTAKMPNIHDVYYKRLSDLEDRVDQLEGLSNLIKINASK